MTRGLPAAQSIRALALLTVVERPRREIVCQNSGLAVIWRQVAHTIAARHRSSRSRCEKMRPRMLISASTSSRAASPSAASAAAAAAAA
jgi:hypothetical protein